MDNVQYRYDQHGCAGGRQVKPHGRGQGAVGSRRETTLQACHGAPGWIGDEVLLTSNNPELLALDDVRVVPDADPGAGALNGLLTALTAARGSHVITAACDMPFVSRELFAYMLERTDRYDVVVPCPGGFYEPLHAIYARAALPAVQAALADGRKRMVSFFREVRVLLIDDAALKRFDPDGMAFFNINTPEDLIKAEQYLGKNA